MAKLAELIERKKSALNAKIDVHNELVGELNAARGADTADTAKVDDLLERKAAAAAEVATLQATLATLEREAEEDAQVARTQAEVKPAEPTTRAYDQVARVTSEERTYTKEKDRRGVGLRARHRPGVRLQRHGRQRPSPAAHGRGARRAWRGRAAAACRRHRRRDRPRGAAVPGRPVRADGARRAARSRTRAARTTCPRRA